MAVIAGVQSGIFHRNTAKSLVKHIFQRFGTFGITYELTEVLRSRGTVRVTYWPGEGFPCKAHHSGKRLLLLV